MTYTSKEWHLVRRPEGWPVPEDFALVTVELPAPGAGQIVVRNSFVSVDPYMRGRMNDVPSYAPPYVLGEPMLGGAVGEVVASANPEIPVGTTVLHGLGWREYALVDAGQARVVDPALAPVSAYLGALGMTGLTAYAGLLSVAGMKPGDTVFVSGAAGAVGQMVGQIAKLRGASRVIGSAGSPEKVAHLTGKLGFDAAFDYHDGPVAKLLAEAAPQGVDVYFDNVGGEHLEAAIGAMNLHARAAICGAIAQYNSTETPTGPRNMAYLIGKRLRLEGFLVGDHAGLMPQFLAEVGPWLRDGKILAEETVTDGVDNAVEAFLGMLRGQNLGKMLVRV
ncbi:NADP-dependent oxidoreductase [Actinorhabdospora filicis]|uniref:NADP-dependent oxidoreductase n=1 Tax=Actinorhabdospora filicis TaxID=1785913 RepID=A0A9W6SL05_9ACTN|nr:NADP-dependent oxidoreductase [Actinorhabdospora filicis]GLZ76541.1 NADP-dependent oxidoreductase [Actinorhabdospora filicis]